MIRECQACSIDFETDNDRTVFCKTKQCRKDRWREGRDKYILKVPKTPGYVSLLGKDKTSITPNIWQRFERRSSKRGEN